MNRAAVLPDVELERSARLRTELEQRSRTTPAMLHSIDAEGRLISVSDLWLAKLGYTREEVIGRRSSDFLTPESREHAVKNVLPEFFRRGRCENVEYQMLCKDGRVIDVLLSGILDNSAIEPGRVSLAVITDVTVLKVIERRLAESEARYRGLVEDQSELVSLATPAGRLLFVNHAYARHYERQPDDMVGKSLFDFVPREAHAAVAEHLRKVCGADQSVEDENQVILPNGEMRWIAWTNRALRDTEGKVTAVQSVGRDVEKRVVAERRLKESEARYRLLAEISTDMILLVRRDGTRFYASPACRTLLGYEPEEMLCISSQEAIHPDDVGFLEDQRAYSDDEATAFNYRMRRKDGSYVWVESVSRAIAAEPGHLPQRLVIVRDIEQRVAAEQRLRESEARYRLLAEHSTDMVLQLDLNLVRRYVSPACREMFGYEPEELMGDKSGGMAHPEDAGRVAQVLQSLRNGHTDRDAVIARRRHRDGRWIWVEAQYRALKDPQTGAVTGIIGTVRDISARKVVEDQLAEANRRLEALAAQDGLTGLANRRAFDDALTREYNRAKREGTRLGLIMIDVDWFKAFNDRYGHPAGDECLRQISAAIRTTVLRPGDMAARYGGEEFAALLPNTDEHGAATIAERIRKAVLLLAMEHHTGANRVVTISAGAAAAQDSFEEGPDALLQNADRALYRAKDSGRNMVVRASSLPPKRSAKPLTAA
ncbi:PAS domain S-box protein [Methylocapsa sp. S129]|uniref:sensor domain-containing diguanylate cyclase n=1 Tax=Methylocapsa sp. S129 TaxID=1641869 RepID=UPI00131B9E88|nr:PAS domain S-box protein [Methylocapsa sp. S129]